MCCPRAVIIITWLFLRKRRKAQVASTKDVSTSSEAEASCDWEIDMHEIKCAPLPHVTR